MEETRKKSSFQGILEASERLKGIVSKTPVLTSSYINTLAKGQLFFKCENFQKAGAFKYRGANNVILTTNKKLLSKGVATHSSGNHAGALAKAAQVHNIPAYIVMPENAPQVKVDAVKGYGAHIIFSKPTLESREITLKEVIKKTGAYFIHPYNNYRIIEGQGTAALELLNKIQGIEIVIAPVGGGGLLSGTSLAAKGIDREIVVFGAEPFGADDAYRSLQKGEIVPQLSPDTIADGLRTSLGTKTFPIITENVSAILRVTEEGIVNAMKLLFERMKIVVEPSSATVFAAVLENPSYFAGKRVGLILSGGNVDLKNLPF
jgi:threonine dehydratase